jgi:hypothetical protein
MWSLTLRKDRRLRVFENDVTYRKPIGMICAVEAMKYVDTPPAILLPVPGFIGDLDALS